MDIKQEVLNMLCRSKKGLVFKEIYEGLLEVEPSIGKVNVRNAVSELVREGRIERVADYERKRMVFRAKAGCEEG